VVLELQATPVTGTHDQISVYHVALNGDAASVRLWPRPAGCKDDAHTCGGVRAKKFPPKMSFAVLMPISTRNDAAWS
jgi:hypothetical protein